MIATTSDNDDPDGVEFKYEDDLATARDVGSDVTTSGKSKLATLSRLADALTLHAGGGEPINDEESFLEDIGVDPDTVEDAGDPPWAK